MRDLSDMPIPTRQELRERLGPASRYQPEPVVRKAPTIRMRDDGHGEVLLRNGAWRPIHVMLAEAARAIEEGGTVADAIERARRHCPAKHEKVLERLVRNFLWKLAKEGYYDIPLPEPPALFYGRFERLKELGRGGMGIVHLCRDLEDDGREVVVKHAWGWTKPIEKAEQGIRQEIAYLARLDHPRIPGLVDVFERDGLMHMVRRFAPGASLFAWRPKLVAAGAGARLRLLRECAQTLAHVHERGLLYLDVKPDNFILGSLEEGPMLLDFGLARPFEGHELRMRGALGSPGYVSPEVAKQNVATVRSDVYGLGRAFVVVATGWKPKFKHKHADVVEQLDAAGIAGVEREVLLRMCADEPAARFADMREVAAAIP